MAAHTCGEQVAHRRFSIFEAFLPAFIAGIFFVNAFQIGTNYTRSDFLLLPLGLRKPLVLPGVEKKALANKLVETSSKVT